MAAVDKADSAAFSLEEILSPTDWVLLNFLMDSRTGLGRSRNFSISNYALMIQLIEQSRDLTIHDILALPDVTERTELYTAHRTLFIEQLHRCTTVIGWLAILDLRAEPVIYAGNRFMVFALFPQCDISMHVLWGVRKENTVFAIGKSILDRSSPVDVGAICPHYGGGGHHAAGTCQVSNDDAKGVRIELVPLLTPEPVRNAA